MFFLGLTDSLSQVLGLSTSELMYNRPPKLLRLLFQQTTVSLVASKYNTFVFKIYKMGHRGLRQYRWYSSV